jgi:hypothetical protein
MDGNLKNGRNSILNSLTLIAQIYRPTLPLKCHSISKFLEIVFVCFSRRSKYDSLIAGFLFINHRLLTNKPIGQKCSVIPIYI